ncbi:MAG: hypothetical protein M3Y87_16170, partial [Myxococcota bacterium]|nr:hypothetical protein [Myxococcota bacterium]
MAMITEFRGRTVGSAVAACLAMGLVAAGSPASAQPSRETRRRAQAAFDSYELEGTRTLDAIRFLDPRSVDGRRISGEPRVARARAAIDLWLIAYLDPRHASLDRRLAHAMTVPARSIAPALRAELDRLDAGDRSATIAELRSALELQQALETGQPISFEGSEGVRRDALLIRAVGRAIEDGEDGELAALIADRCAGDGACESPWSSWAPSSRRVIGALLEASLALERLDRAWQEGDPFARAIW